jgi:CBS domain-containing protein
MSVQGILKEKGCVVVTAPPKATVADACRVLHDNHIGAIVVVDEQNAIKGIFTERDVVSASQGTARRRWLRTSSR